MAIVAWQETIVTSNERRRILVVGKKTPLTEGVSDLLQVGGFPVDVSSTWAETEYALHDRPPDLVIVDLSITTPDADLIAEQIRRIPHWSDVPILFVSFSGDDRIRELQWRSQKNGDKGLHFYAHTLLSIDGLLEKVRACLAQVPSAVH
jgi:DNA-binding response OmpR family regulator